ncbi:MAG: AAA family ATPase [Candidatus Malihini olakiniferum]
MLLLYNHTFIQKTTFDTLTNKQLRWQHLLPDYTPYQSLFDRADNLESTDFSTLQPRLADSLNVFCHPRSPSRFMLVKAEETKDYLMLIASAVRNLYPKTLALYGSRYIVKHDRVDIQPAAQFNDNFAAKQACEFKAWVEADQLFGCVRYYQERINLEAGLLHRINGGILILTALTLLAQPMLWLRLKQVIEEGQYHWLSPDEKSRPLPFAIPPIPMNVRLIVVGNRESLGDLYDTEPDMRDLAIYGEFESELPLINKDDMTRWCAYVNTLCRANHLPLLSADAWPSLLQLAVRYSGDHDSLPLCPQWLTYQLKHIAIYVQEEHITAQTIANAIDAKRWREGYLSDRINNEIELGQILIETKGEIIGQVNGLSLLKYPGHPVAFGEPTRISCVVYPGDGEFTDVDRKAELAGNVHAKGMMIMRAFLISELDLKQQLPFSASLVFEQSYTEVDGDSASLAGVCASISALSQQPINQQMAITGSIDQFGRVQPVGGVNEKIESFFKICQRRELTGNQGVIIPAANLRHLSLNLNVVNAVRDRKFHIILVETVPEAITLLTKMAYDHEQHPNLLSLIKERIAQFSSPERQRFSWFFR